MPNVDPTVAALLGLQAPSDDPIKGMQPAVTKPAGLSDQQWELMKYSMGANPNLESAAPRLSDALGNSAEIKPASSGSKVIDALFGMGGQERYQTWPERMVRSAVTLPGDVAAGREQYVPGLRREDVTDVPRPTGPTVDSTWLGRKLGLAPVAAEPNDPVIERAQDLAGLAAGAPLAERPGVGTLGSGAMRDVPKEIPKEVPPLEAPSAPPFYSAVENAVTNAKLNKATPDQWLGYLKNQSGVKQDELSWLGLNDLPNGQSLTKQDLSDYVNAHKVDLKEVTKGTPDPDAGVVPTGDNTKYEQYQLPGGENYREMLLTLPQKEQRSFDMLSPSEKADLKARYEKDFGEGSLESEGDLREYHDQYQAKDQGAKADYRSSHWDELNVLAHVRFNDRLVPDPKNPAGEPLKTLFLEEIQSDWGQAGRKSGFDDPVARAAVEKKLNDAGYPISGEDARSAAEAGIITPEEARTLGNRSYVPAMPFPKTWPDLTLKRMIRHAAENGYDALAWTPGEVQANRYDLSKQINELKAVRRPSDSTYTLSGTDANGHPFSLGSGIQEAKLADHVGKELAEKIAKQDANQNTYAGLDLKVGGEGMKAFYDKMLPDKANAIAKRYGSRVQPAEIPETLKKTLTGYGATQPSQSVHMLKITPELKDAALKHGFPLFQSGIPLPNAPPNTDATEADRYNAMRALMSANPPQAGTN